MREFYTGIQLTLFPPNLPVGSTGLLTHGADIAASTVASNACLNVLMIQSVCVCVYTV